MNPEQQRLIEVQAGGRRWDLFGPYLSERAWGTVREDYSADGNAWTYFPHDHARSRTYRWSEDGIGGISDDKQRICFALSFWNGQDAILKERLFGLAGPEGNHGEDVKEYYFYLDSAPTHSYMQMLYKYPQAAYPYSQLVQENARRGRAENEFELVDTGIFNDNRYFDIFIEYAKDDPEDMLIQVRAINRGPERATLHLLPKLWFRNTWAWDYNQPYPMLDEVTGDGIGLSHDGTVPTVKATHHILGEYYLYCEGADELLFTNNETNTQRLFGAPNASPYVKDGINNYVVNGERTAVNPAKTGTQMAAHYTRTIEPGATEVIRLRLCQVNSRFPSQAAQAPSPQAQVSRPQALTPESKTTIPPLPTTNEELTDFKPFADFDEIFKARQQENEQFYNELQPVSLSDDERRVQRQALAGMLWSKQFYHYIVEQWLKGDPTQPPPPRERLHARNWEWRHLYNERVMSMPDKWEYPWYAAWDLAFHCIPLALVDSYFSKSQLDILMREWYQHPNGAVPAYEWAFGDVNPPVLAWAAWRVYEIEHKQTGQADRSFLECVFHKLMLSFNWWVNRKDSGGNNIFQGGFLGLDNIGVFDRSAPLPTGGYLEQSDGTSWMAMFCLNMMKIALELARENHVYENIATKFFEHFLSIADAMNNLGGEGIDLWDNEDEFFYDVLSLPNGGYIRLKVRSLVGLIPLLAVETIEPDLLTEMPGFRQRLEWYLTNRPDLARLISRWEVEGLGERRMLGLVRGHRMKCLLKRMLDPNEFLSDYGIRSVSKFHAEHPYELHFDQTTLRVDYEPAESRSGLFGGNSNWRGPVWFPINYLLIETLQKFHHYYGDEFKVECPTGSGQYLTLNEVADDLSQRLMRLFERDETTGKRPFNADNQYFQNDPHWRDNISFYEYFHGETGAGLGASHQTGWTGLVAKLIQQQGEKREKGFSEG